MSIKIKPWEPTDRDGYYCMPLLANVPEEKGKEKGWELTSCPECGAECWRIPSLAKVVEAQGVKGLCTQCALKKARRSVCHFDSTRECDEPYCSECEYVPADDDKPNGRKDPLPIKWEEGYGGGFDPVCPACGEMPYSYDRCFFCGQKFIKDDRAREYEKPPETVVMDCFSCGGKGTMKGVRARSNGHFHGRCEKCGCRIIE